MSTTAMTRLSLSLSLPITASCSSWGATGRSGQPRTSGDRRNRRVSRVLDRCRFRRCFLERRGGGVGRAGELFCRFRYHRHYKVRRPPMKVQEPRGCNASELYLGLVCISSTLFPLGFPSDGVRKLASRFGVVHQVQTLTESEGEQPSSSSRTK